jgi:hypothetical protein
VQSTWDEVVARAFGCWIGHDRRLDLEKALRVQEVADVLDDAVAEGQVAGHPWSAEIDVPVLEAETLVDGRFFGDGKRQGQTAIQNEQGVAMDLDRTGADLGVLASGRARLDASMDFDDELVADFSRDSVRVWGSRGIDDDLHEAGSIAQIDKDEAAMIPDRVHPALQEESLANVGWADLATQHGAFHTECSVISVQSTVRHKDNGRHGKRPLD